MTATGLNADGGNPSRSGVLGKGIEGLIGEIRKDTFSKDETIVFVHTARSAAFFANEVLFSEKAA